MDRNELFTYIYLEITLLSSRMCDYPTITQGKTRIPGINDGEEFEITDVSYRQESMCKFKRKFTCKKFIQHMTFDFEVFL